MPNEHPPRDEPDTLPESMRKPPVQPDDLAPVTEEEQHMALTEDQVPRHGWIHGGADRRRERRFAFAVPMLTLMAVLTLLIMWGVIVVGWRGGLEAAMPAWYLGLPLVTLIAVATGAWAAQRGWSRYHPTGPWVPIAIGVGTGLVVAFVGFAVLGFLTVSAV